MAAVPAAFAQAPAQADPLPALPLFGAALSCSAGLGDASVLSATKADSGFKVEADTGTWVTQQLSRIGYPAPLPASGVAKDAALRAATLLRRGNIVAAKMANDEAASRLPAYRTSAFTASFESLLTVLTQPVAHASYPSFVRAAGETTSPAERAFGTHGFDLEKSSAALAEVVHRAQVSKRAMGADYQTPSVRYYLLAHGFRDPVALRSAAAAVCALGLDKATRERLDVSARFMAMPSAAAAEEPQAAASPAVGARK